MIGKESRNERTRAKVVAVGDAPPAAAVIGGKTSGRKKSDIGTFSYGEMISVGPFAVCGGTTAIWTTSSSYCSKS